MYGNSGHSLSELCLQTFVIFQGTDEIKTANIRTVDGQILNKESLHELILILQSKMKHFAKKELDKFPFKVKVFQVCSSVVEINFHTSDSLSGH